MVLPSPGERVEQRHVGDAQAAVVGGVLAEGELAVEVLGGDAVVRGRRFEAVVLLDFAVGALVELLAVFGGLPLAQVAVAVVFRALVVEAVGHFVADDHADAAEVDGRDRC